MREVFGAVTRFLQRGVTCALATLVETRYSSPAPLGTTIAVDAGGSITGNIGAGCYEGEIVDACFEALRNGELRMLDIDLADAGDIDGSPGCGGALRIAVWRPAKPFIETSSAISSGTTGVTLTVGAYRIDIPAKGNLILVGATTLAQQIAHMARDLDYFVTVVDPRPLFATAERIPDADSLVLEWPDAYLPGALKNETALVVLSHDPKFDIPALRCALESEAPYIGLLGSRRSQAARRESLRQLGFGDAQLARIHGPVGMDLGGTTIGETALSILSQIVALRNGRAGAALDSASGAIHACPQSLSS